MLEAYTTVGSVSVTVLRFCNIFGYGHYRGGPGRGRALDTLLRGALRGEGAKQPAALDGEPARCRRLWSVRRSGST